MDKNWGDGGLEDWRTLGGDGRGGEGKGGDYGVEVR